MKKLTKDIKNTEEKKSSIENLTGSDLRVYVKKLMVTHKKVFDALKDK
jgi:hypothetical protein